MKLQKTVFALATVLVALVAHSPAFGQDFPNRPVKIIVPFSSGTAADIVARQLARRLGAVWPQGVVVENLPGAAGNIGAATVAQAAPDGHTLVMLGINHVINPSLYKDTKYDIHRDFRPIVRIAVAPLAIVAHPGLKADTIPELVALAKARPGELLYGSGGSGSVTHLSFELLKARTGISMTHVPYKSIAPMLTDIIGNQIPLGSPAAASAVSHVKAGTLKVLALTSARRSSAFPGVPTVAEGGVKDYDVSAWNGLVAPKDTPDAVVAKIHADTAQIVQSQEFSEVLSRQAMDVDLLGPSEFEKFLAAELDKWSELVKSSGAKVD